MQPAHKSYRSYRTYPALPICLPASCIHGAPPSLWEMKLYLVRHGAADWPDWKRSDDERPLTDKGKEEVAEVGKLLRALRVEIAPFILSSPLPRARDTAEILARFLKTEVRQENGLRPGFGKTEFAKLLQKFEGENLMIVGHEPDFTRLIMQLTGGATKMSKAGVALVKFDAAAMKGELRWLLPPKIATNLA